ncbi:MAG: aminotransferase class IV [Flavobacteriales bacterium]|nr:aminotransferase class IV [Flavobacteriales bacterium]
MKYQMFNGELVGEDENLIHVSNRGFRYGDGFFESMRLSNGKLLFSDLHWKRLVLACDVLRIKIPSDLTPEVLRSKALQLAKANQEPNSRIRFQGFRSGSGRYNPESSVLSWAMVSEPIDEPTYSLNKRGITIGICNGHSINPLPQSGFKSCNSVPYVLGSIYAQEHGWDDCLLLDAEGFIAEGTGSNVFLVQGKALITPDLQHGGVPGVMRTVLLHEAQTLGFEILPQLVKEDDLLEADECFLSTATRGIVWVGAFGKKRYFKRVAEQLVKHINAKYIG